MTKTLDLKSAFTKQSAAVFIPNRAIDELSLSALGFYGTILDLVQNSNVVFNSKEEVLKSMLERTPSATRNAAEKAYNELLRKGYIKPIKSSNNETINITYGLQPVREGER